MVLLRMQLNVDYPDRDIDEKLPVYVRIEFKGSQLSYATVKAYLSRLVVTLEVSAVNAINSRYSSLGTKTPQTVNPESTANVSYPISTVILDYASLGSVEAVKSLDHSEFSTNEGNMWHAYWSVDVLISHPKARLVNPRILVSANTSLRTRNEGGILTTGSDGEAVDTQSAEFLQPLEPVDSFNLLGALAQGMYLTGTPRLLIY